MTTAAQKRPFASNLKDNNMLSSDKAFCLHIVRALIESEHAYYFLEPVDPIFFNIPDYFDIIKNPMDLGTVYDKLKKNEYQFKEECFDDVNLIFQNCYLYNNETDPVCCEARHLEGVYKELLLKNKGSQSKAKKAPAKKSPAKTCTQPITPISNDSYLDEDDNRSDSLMDFNDQQQTQDQSEVKNNMLDVLFGDDDLSEEEQTEEEQTKEEVVTVEKKPTERRMAVDQHKRCASVIKELKKAKHDAVTWPFKEPVDTVRYGCHDYYQIVKHPMDMSTYEKKFKEHQYHHEDELAADIQLMIENAFLYNPPNNEVHQLAKKLQRLFKKYWADLHPSTSHKSVESSEERPKKKLKSKDTNQLINNNNNDSSKPATPILRLKISVKPQKEKDESSRKDTKLVLKATKASPDQPSQPVNNQPSQPIVQQSRSSHNQPSRPIVQQSQPVNNQQSRPIIQQSRPVHNQRAQPTSSAPIASSSSAHIASSSSKTSSYVHSSTQYRRSSSSSTSSSEYNLAIDPNPPNANKKREHPLQGHDDWIARAAKKVRSIPAPPQLYVKPRTNKPQQAVRRKDGFDLSSVHPPQPVRRKDTVSDLLDKFDQEKKQRIEREEFQRKREQKMIEEREERKRQDRERRQAELNKSTIDISRQKVMMNNFEKNEMHYDKDFRNLFRYHRETVDYRRGPIEPSFVKQSPVSLSEIKNKLLSKIGRTNNNNDDDDESDMDIE